MINGPLPQNTSVGTQNREVSHITMVQLSFSHVYINTRLLKIESNIHILILIVNLTMSFVAFFCFQYIIHSRGRHCSF